MRQFQVIKTVKGQGRIFRVSWTLSNYDGHIFLGQLGNFWCVIASVSANKLACEGLLVGADEQKKASEQW